MYNTTVSAASTQAIIPTHHGGVDQFLTDTVPGFNFHLQNPSTTSSPVSSLPVSSSSETLPTFTFNHVSADGPSGNDVTAPQQADFGNSESASDGDQAFWEMINGGREEDLDFSAFLRNFNDDGSAL